MPTKTIGLIVNPIAGMGGRVGLKGTDGEANLLKAVALGARPVSPGRTIEALQSARGIWDQIALRTCPGAMGAEEALRAGIRYERIDVQTGKETSADDTKEAARMLQEVPVDLLLFAGGDGTARDVYDAVGQRTPVVGIPSGVKMHSGVFALNPASAGELLVQFVRGGVTLEDAEVMDVDEAAFRMGRVAGRLYGYLKVPRNGGLVQQSKAGRGASEDEADDIAAIADYVVEEMDEDYYYVLGSGTTIKAVADRLGVGKTLLGVDVVHGGRVVAMDVSEERLLNVIKAKNVRLVVSPVGGQGFLFGRGNQQISPRVIKRVGKRNIIVLATASKLSGLGSGGRLLVDTGDSEVDGMLKGYVRVVTGYREETGVEVGG